MTPDVAVDPFSEEGASITDHAGQAALDEAARIRRKSGSPPETWGQTASASPGPATLPGDDTGESAAEDDRGESPFMPGHYPRVHEGIVIPAESVTGHQRATTEWFPASKLARLRRTERAVGCYVEKQWVLLMVSDDSQDLDDGLHALLASMAKWSGRRR